MFIDEVKIHVKGGLGGNGALAFRREKFVARGGPSGGHGGHGGNIVLKVNAQLNTLIHFKKQVHYKAEKGTHGGGKDKRGANGADTIIPVPAGTVVRHPETRAVLADLTEPDQEFIIARGGRGGRGNAAFKTANRQAPRIVEKGLPGQEGWIILELKLIADVGIIGVPNAGKSTLLASVTAAKPKIANYPFTTIQPNLGVVVIDHQDFVMADIPGLIEGAHEGVGLGHQFLRHVERTRLLIHLLDGASTNPVGEFEQINDELRLFNPTLAEKPQIVVLNKHDLPSAHAHWPTIEALATERDWPVMFVSAVTQNNVQDLMRLVNERLALIPKTPPMAATETPVFTLEDDEAHFTVDKQGDGYHVAGKVIQDLVWQTRWEIDEGAKRAQQQLESLGVLEALRKAGVEAGDTVFLADMEMEWLW